MKRPFPIALAVAFAAIAVVAASAADARPIGASQHISMNGPRAAPRTHLDLPHDIPARKNVRGHCVLKFIPRALSAGYSDRPRGHFGYGRRYHPGNGGKLVYEQKLVCG